MNLMQDSTGNITSKFLVELKGGTKESMNHRLKNIIELENFRAYQTCVYLWSSSALIPYWFYHKLEDTSTISSNWVFTMWSMSIG